MSSVIVFKNTILVYELISNQKRKESEESEVYAPKMNNIQLENATPTRMRGRQHNYVVAHRTGVFLHHYKTKAISDLKFQHADVFQAIEEAKMLDGGDDSTIWLRYKMDRGDKTYLIPFMRHGKYICARQHESVKRYDEPIATMNKNEISTPKKSRNTLKQVKSPYTPRVSSSVAKTSSQKFTSKTNRPPRTPKHKDAVLSQKKQGSIVKSATKSKRTSVAKSTPVSAAASSKQSKSGTKLQQPPQNEENQNEENSIFKAFDFLDDDCSEDRTCEEDQLEKSPDQPLAGFGHYKSNEMKNIQLENATPTRMRSRQHDYVVIHPAGVSLHHYKTKAVSDFKFQHEDVFPAIEEVQMLVGGADTTKWLRYKMDKDNKTYLIPFMHGERYYCAKRDGTVKRYEEPVDMSVSPTMNKKNDSTPNKKRSKSKQMKSPLVATRVKSSSSSSLLKAAVAKGQISRNTSLKNLPPRTPLKGAVVSQKKQGSILKSATKSKKRTPVSTITPVSAAASSEKSRSKSRTKVQPPLQNKENQPEHEHSALKTLVFQDEDDSSEEEDQHQKSSDRKEAVFGHSKSNDYFTAAKLSSSSSKHAKDLKELAMPGTKELNQALAQCTDTSPEMTNAPLTEFLMKQYLEQFPFWRRTLLSGFNLLFSGVGSKRTLLNHFALSTFPEATIIVQLGYLEKVSVKHLAHHVLSSKTKRSTRTIYVIHSIDGKALRTEEAQDILSRLCHRNPGSCLIASIDHINAMGLWNEKQLGLFNWIRLSTPTFVPYTEERVLKLSVAGLSQERSVGSIQHVMSALAPNQRTVLVLIAEHQLNHHHHQPPSSSSSKSKAKISQHGMKYSELMTQCQRCFFTDDVEGFLRTICKELASHALIREKMVDNTKWIGIPLDQRTLRLAICPEEEEEDVEFSQ